MKSESYGAAGKAIRGLVSSDPVRGHSSVKSDAWFPSKNRGPGPARAARSLGL